MKNAWIFAVVFGLLGILMAIASESYSLAFVLGSSVSGVLVACFVFSHFRGRLTSRYKEEINLLNSKLNEKGNYESEIQNLRGELESLGEHKIGLASEIEEMEGAVSKYSTDISDLSQELYSAQAILKGAQEEKEVRNKHKEELDELVKSKEVVAEKIRSLKSERRSVSEKLSELQSQLVSVEHDFDLQQHGLYS